MGDADRDTLEIPLAPLLTPPRLSLEFHTGFAVPLDHHALCPAGAGCVLQSGGGLGASVERRHPSGFGALIGYDVWFLDSDSVYELGVQQLFRGGFRYTAPTDIVFHPIFELCAGGTVYGDTFAVATFGALLHAFGGAEIELTDTFGLRVGFGLRAFSHTHFRTARDGVARGAGNVFTEMVFTEVGLTIM